MADVRTDGRTVCIDGPLLSNICHKSHQEISHVICKIQGRQTYLLPGSNEALDTARFVWIMALSDVCVISRLLARGTNFLRVVYLCLWFPLYVCLRISSYVCLYVCHFAHPFVWLRLPALVVSWAVTNSLPLSTSWNRKECFTGNFHKSF